MAAATSVAGIVGVILKSRLPRDLWMARGRCAARPTLEPVLIRSVADPLPRTVWGETWRILLARDPRCRCCGWRSIVDSEQPGTAHGTLRTSSRPSRPVRRARGAGAAAVARRRFPLPASRRPRDPELPSPPVRGCRPPHRARLAWPTHRRWRAGGRWSRCLGARAASSTRRCGPTGDGCRTAVATNVVIGVLASRFAIAIGYYIGARRDLFASWRERAETAEREQASRVAQAQGQRARPHRPRDARRPRPPDLVGGHALRAPSPTAPT